MTTSKQQAAAGELRAAAATIRETAHTALQRVKAAAGESVAAALLASLQELTTGLDRVAQVLDVQRIAGGIHPADAPPRETFGSAADPVIESVDDLAAVLRWLGWLKVRGDSIKARSEAQVALAREFAARDMHVEVDGLRLTFAEWRQKLEAAAGRFLKDHADQVFDGKKRSREFPAGTASLTARKPTIALKEGVKADEIVERLAKRVKSAIDQLLEKAGLTGRLKVSFGLDLDGFKRLHKAGQISGRDLPKGLTITKAEDRPGFKPVTHTAGAESAA